MSSTISPMRKQDVVAACFALGFPTFVTLVYFQWLANSAPWIQQTAYGLGKTLQFGFPIAYVWLFHRDKLFFRQHQVLKVDQTGRLNNFHYGLVFGVAVAVLMFTIYFMLIDRTDIAIQLKLMVAAKVNSIGLNTVWKYAALGIFYAVCHSFLEEYYWRWFVFDLLRTLTAAWKANVLSSLGFMAHHVVLLGFFLGFASPLTYLFSIAVAIGGSFWAWLYARGDGLVSPWVSHLIVDAAIFMLGFLLIRETVFQV